MPMLFPCMMTKTYFLLNIIFVFCYKESAQNNLNLLTKENNINEDISITNVTNSSITKPELPEKSESSITIKQSILTSTELEEIQAITNQNITPLADVSKTNEVEGPATTSLPIDDSTTSSIADDNAVNPQLPEVELPEKGLPEKGLPELPNKISSSIPDTDVTSSVTTNSNPVSSTAVKGSNGSHLINKHIENVMTDNKDIKSQDGSSTDTLTSYDDSKKQISKSLKNLRDESLDSLHNTESGMNRLRSANSNEAIHDQKNLGFKSSGSLEDLSKSMGRLADRFLSRSGSGHIHGESIEKNNTKSKPKSALAALGLIPKTKSDEFKSNSAIVKNKSISNGTLHQIVSK